MPEEFSVEVDVTDPFAEPPGPAEPFPKVRTRPPALLDELAFLEESGAQPAAKASIPVLETSAPGELAGLWNDLSLDDGGSAGASAIQGDQFAPPPVDSIDVESLLRAGQVPPTPTAAPEVAPAPAAPAPPPAASSPDEAFSFDVDMGAEVAAEAAGEEIEFTLADVVEAPAPEGGLKGDAPAPPIAPLAGMAASSGMEIDLDLGSLEPMAVDETAPEPAHPGNGLDIEVDFGDVAASLATPEDAAGATGLAVSQPIVVPSEPPAPIQAPPVVVPQPVLPDERAQAATPTPPPPLSPSLKDLAALTAEDTARELATLARDAEGRGRPDIAVKLWRAASLLDPLFVPAMRALKKLTG